MSYYPGYGHGVDPMSALTGAFGSMSMGTPVPGYYMPRVVPAVPRVRFEANFKKADGSEEVKPLDINGVIRMLDMPPATLHRIVSICDFPNGDTIEIHMIYTHKGRREAGAYQFHVVAMYHYNIMNRPYIRGSDGSIHMMANGTPGRLDHMFIKLPDTAAHGTAYSLSVLYNLLGGNLTPDEQAIVGRRLGRGYVAMPGILDEVLGMRVMGGDVAVVKKKRGRSMTRKGQGKRKSTRRGMRR